MSRAAGERVRIAQDIEHMRACLVGLEAGMRAGGPIGHEVAQAITTSAFALAMRVASHDAYARAEEAPP